MRIGLKYRKSGNMMIIILVSILTVSIITTHLTKAAYDVRLLESKMQTTWHIYDDLAADKLAALAFREDTGSWFATRATPFGVLEDFTMEAYKETVEAIQNKFFITAADGSIRYNSGSIEQFAENANIDSPAAGDIKASLLELSGRIEDNFSIVLLNNLEINGGSSKNTLTFKSNDLYELQDITFQVFIKDGNSVVTQNYLLSGLTITFTESLSGIKGTVGNQNTELTLLSQTID